MGEVEVKICKVACYVSVYLNEFHAAAIGRAANPYFEESSESLDCATVELLKTDAVECAREAPGAELDSAFVRSDGEAADVSGCLCSGAKT